ncbi:MAG: LacI family DNA-binding transcriptional regulator [Ruminococcus sp.]
MAKAVRMSDIAERLHVSIVTVSKALAGKDGVSEEMRQEIQQLAQEMGYQGKKNRTAPSAAYTLGIVTSYRYIEQGQSFYWNLYERVLYHLTQNGHLGILEVVTDEAEQEQQIPRLVQEERVDGVIVMGNFTAAYRNALVAAGIPMVVLDAFDARFHQDAVISDGYYGMYTMVDYLLQMGHRDIMFVGSVNETSSITDRYYGYCRAMREAGIPVTEAHVLPDRDAEGKVAVSLEHLERMPTAFACNCDITAHILINHLKQQGIRVPEDVSVVGFDNYVLAEYAQPPLTTYAVDVDHMAKMSAQQLIRRIQKPDADVRRIVVSGKLIVRESVRRLETT